MTLNETADITDVKCTFSGHYNWDMYHEIHYARQELYEASITSTQLKQLHSLLLLCLYNYRTQFLFLIIFHCL